MNHRNSSLEPGGLNVERARWLFRGELGHLAVGVLEQLPLRQGFSHLAP